jgi:hypothetical protein
MANRISRSIPKYITYMQNTNAYLLKPSPAPFTNLNWQRIGWLSTELTSWQGFLADILPFNVDKQHRTPTITLAANQVIDNTRDYDKVNHVLDRISAASPTQTNLDDFTTFGIKHNIPVSGSGLPTARRTATTNLVWSIVKGVGGGVIHFEVRADKSSKRACKLKGFDVGIVYLILNATDVVPTTTDLLTVNISSSKANHTFQLPENTVGKRIAISFYWKHKTNPALNGPKSTIQVVIVT